MELELKVFNQVSRQHGNDYQTSVLTSGERGGGTYTHGHHGS
jgi:hypothetical protein